MEKKYFDELMTSLEDAAAFAQGDTSRARGVLGVSTRTVEAWEAGRNVPSGAARHLLFLLDGDHSLVQRLVVK